MVKLTELVEQKEFAPALFCFCFVLFVFPLFILTPERPVTIFFCFYTPWVLVIFLLYVVSRRFKTEAASAEEDSSDEGAGHV